MLPANAAMRDCVTSTAIETSSNPKREYKWELYVEQLGELQQKNNIESSWAALGAGLASTH